mgnify:CR=1 FL=1
MSDAPPPVVPPADGGERWRLALEAAGDGIWDWDLRSGSQYRSPRWGGMLGYSAAETAALEWRRLLHPEDRDEALRRLEACLHGATEVYAAEFRLLGKDGRYHWIQARGGVCERDAAGNPQRFVGTHRDIGGARAELDNLERLWRFALEGHGDARWDWSIDGGEIHVSPSFRSIIGLCGNRPVRGNDIWPERLHPADLRRAMAVFDAHLRGREPIADVEFRLRCEDGAYRWVAVRGKVMERNAAGKALRMTGTVRDVHDRHLAVEREKRQAQELARAGRLIHVGEMATALAHELNQPLTAIRNFSGVVLRRLDAVGPLADPIREPLQMIAQQALRAGEIVHRVRGFVRKGRPVTVPVAIGSVVRSVVRFMQPDLGASNVRVVVDLAEGLPRVLADRVQLEQVLANLIRNAIDAMAALAGERVLRISARPGADGCVELAVADQGPGLAEAIRADPFLPFATTKPDGVGLGLPICRTIVENHGGRLWVEHSSPAGTTFCFTLPALAG